MDKYTIFSLNSFYKSRKKKLNKEAKEAELRYQQEMEVLEQRYKEELTKAKDNREKDLERFRPKIVTQHINLLKDNNNEY